MAFAGFLVLGATSAMATCMGGNACTPGNDWAAGGGWVEGGGTGYGVGNNNFTGGGIVDRGSFAESMTGFNGNFRFAADACGTCQEDTPAVFGTGFSTHRAGSFIETTGGHAGASSETFGGAGGEGYAWSGRRAQ